MWSLFIALYISNPAFKWSNISTVFMMRFEFQGYHYPLNQEGLKRPSTLGDHTESLNTGLTICDHLQTDWKAA